MELIEKLIAEFSVAQLKFFFRNKIKTFKPDEENYDYLFEEKEDPDFQDITKIGEAYLSNSDDLIIITAKVNKILTSKSDKKKQFEIAKKILKEENKDAAIFIFYDNAGSFRFSLIRANFLGAKRDFTDFKRFTYFVSKSQTNKTFKAQIEKADFNDLNSIQDAFSVEPLTKDFYEKIQHWYFWAIYNSTFPSEPTVNDLGEWALVDKNKLQELINNHKAQNVIRMLTRILFVWFIKQKKLIPDELLVKSYFLV